MTDQLDLDGLERLAKAATPGPWTIDPSNEWDDGTNLPEQINLRVNGSQWGKVVDSVNVDECDAAYIAAANPATILALISQAREAERMRGVRANYADRAKFADHDVAAHYRDFVRSLDQALAEHGQ